jgi:signal peptidase II
MNRVSRLCLIALLLLSTASCDQLTKKVAKAELASSEPISLLNDLIRLDYAENPGAFLSVGENLPSPIFLSFSFVFVGAIIWLMLLSTKNRDMNVAVLAGLSLMAGGGIGNLIDRLMNAGAVVDFISVGVGPIRSGIFNLADVAILTGAFVSLIQMWKGRSKTDVA